MGIMMMNMSQGKIEIDEAVNAEYDDEIMSSGWNPLIGLTLLVPEDNHKSFPAELANVDVETFLKKMYG
jgi:hypothetical protein